MPLGTSNLGRPRWNAQAALVARAGDARLRLRIARDRRACRVHAAQARRTHAAPSGLRTPDPRWIEGAAADALPRVAESLAASLLVMGAVSRSRLQEIFLGSTAERVLDRIGCDVLVVKPADFSEKLPF